MPEGDWCVIRGRDVWDLWVLDYVWLQVTEGVLTGANIIESKLLPDNFKLHGAVAPGTEVEGL